jgi:hypothetical protein
MVIAGYILHNYEHVITKQLYQLWKVQSTNSLSPRIVSMYCLCSRDAVAFSEEWHISIGP